MEPIETADSNTQLVKPKDWDEAVDGECKTLKVWTGTVDGQALMQSFWRPSDIELTQLMKGHAVVLTIFGLSHPPVWLGVTARAVNEPLQKST